MKKKNANEIRKSLKSKIGCASPLKELEPKGNLPTPSLPLPLLDPNY